MHPDSNSTTGSQIARFLRERPWIWIVLGYCAVVIAIISVVVIA